MCAAACQSIHGNKHKTNMRLGEGNNTNNENKINRWKKTSKKVRRVEMCHHVNDTCCKGKFTSQLSTRPKSHCLKHYTGLCTVLTTETEASSKKGPTNPPF